MSIIEIILLAAGLSMDSLAVSVTCGSLIRDCHKKQIFKISIIFAVFHFVLTVVGYLLGVGFRYFIEAVDHWIAFSLLLYLGGKMIKGCFGNKEEEYGINPLCTKTLCGLGVAISIDALAVGISLALIGTSLVSIATAVGVITFLFSYAGVVIGNKLGHKVDFKLDLLGGLILIAIGTKILLEHTLGI